VSDLLLTACLVVLLPSYQLWRSLKTRNTPPKPGVGRYVRGMAIAVVLTVAMLAIWLGDGRSWTALGLGLPLPGLIGLGLAVVGLVGMGVLMRRQMTAAGGPPKVASDLLPTTPNERRMFLVMGVVLGVAWELLYRGYLLWMLAPRLGTVAAVVIASAAYGAAHGYKGPKPFVGSLLSALIFTTAYALSHSLWWLMLIHAGLPILMMLAAVGVSGPLRSDLARSEAA
jgi:membrane protease YdiL (CAAX protease family)